MTVQAAHRSESSYARLSSSALARSLVSAGLVLAMPFTALSAQRVQQTAMHRPTPLHAVSVSQRAPSFLRPAARSGVDTTVHVVEQPRHRGPLHHALVGAGWGALGGAGAGAVVALTIRRRPHTDHSEDALPFLLVPYGAIVGASFGAALGAILGRD